MLGISWTFKGWLCRAMLGQQEIEYFEADDTMKKIDNKCELDVKEEMNEEECDDECDSESESKEDRHFLCRIFDGWIHYVCVMWHRNWAKIRMEVMWYDCLWI